MWDQLGTLAVVIGLAVGLSMALLGMMSVGLIRGIRIKGSCGGIANGNSTAICNTCGKSSSEACSNAGVGKS